MGLKCEFQRNDAILSVSGKEFQAHVCGNKKLKCIAGAGITTSILMSQQTSHDALLMSGEARQFVSNDKVYDRFYISPTVSAGIQYDFSDKLFLRAEPGYTMLTPARYIEELRFMSGSHNHVLSLNVAVYRKF